MKKILAVFIVSLVALNVFANGSQSGGASGDRTTIIYLKTA